MPYTVTLTFPNRTVSFALNYNPDSIADVTAKFLFERDGACEPEVMHVMNRVLREGDLAVDGGANIGVFTLLMSRLVGETGTVLAFEPAPNNIHALDANVKLNQLKNVRAIRAALWSVFEDLTVHLSPDSGMNSLRRHDECVGATTVLGVRLDENCDVVPRLIKLDIEGAEFHALAGSLHLLERGVPYVICEINQVAMGRFGVTEHDLRRQMHTLGYEMFLLHPSGVLPTLVPPGTSLKGENPNFNVLFSTVAHVGEAWPEVTFG